jgi:hypothetical protein
LCRQCIEWSVGAPMPFPGLLRFATQMFLDTIQQFDWALFLRCSQKFQKLRLRPTRGIALPVGLPGSNPHSVMGGRPKSTRE